MKVDRDRAVTADVGVREDQGLDHTLPRKHILARPRRAGPWHDDPA